MIDVSGPWSLGIVETRKGSTCTLLNREGRPIWPVGVGRLNRQKMDVHDESTRWWNRWSKQSEHIQLLSDLSKKAGFEFGSDLSELVFNSEIPCFFQPTSVELAARGRYMTEPQHSTEYPGQPYDRAEGRGRVPIDPVILAAEITDAIRRYPNIVAINLTEYLWGARVWKLPFDQMVEEMVTIVETSKKVAPQYMVIWSHALTQSKPANIDPYWNDQNLIEAFDQFVTVGGDLITLNWYPETDTLNLKALVRSNKRVRWFLEHPTGLSEFGHLVQPEFQRAVEGSESGRRSLSRENVLRVKSPSEYPYPVISTWAEKVEKFTSYIISAARDPRCVLVSPYSAEDHNLMQWGYIFNPYTWEPYQTAEIASAIRKAKELRSEILGIDLLGED